MKKETREIGFQLCGLHIREAEGESEKSRTIEGHAVVFGVRSVNLTPWSSYREVYEVIEPGSISQELIDKSDVVLTAFHDNEIILGRSVNGKGTLKLSLDAKGMLCSCELAKTAKADELLSSIERGDITGMSFAFSVNEADSENCVSYEKMEEKSADGKEVWLCHIKRVEALYDVTIAGHPAYPQTDIAQREADKDYDTLLGEPEAVKVQREVDERQKAEAMAREMDRRAINLRKTMENY